MGKILNTKFFDNKEIKAIKLPDTRSSEPSEEKPVMPAPVSRNDLKEIIDLSKEYLDKIGFKYLANDLTRIYHDTLKEYFTVGVVGEFSKGKSSLINKLTGCNILPEGNLPTTSLMTSIRYGGTPQMIVFSNDGTRNVLPLKKESWKGLTVNNLGDNEREGRVSIYLKNKWLGKYGIEIIDTPGAGDLNEKRSKVIGDALVRCDGAIITISATSPLSISEKIFIEQRLIANKTPFMALVITKIDQIPENEREKLVDYIKSRLSMWKLNIPVIVMDDLRDNSPASYNSKSIVQLRNLLVSWIQRPERTRLTNIWLSTQILNVLNNALTAVREQQKLQSLKEDERAEAIEEKKKKLSEFSLVWEDLRIELLKRRAKCYDEFINKYRKLEANLVERLQYEASHVMQVQKWWQEDYPYRFKIETANIASALDELVSKNVANDARWLNTQLSNKFKSFIDVDRPSLSGIDETDRPFNKNIEFEDLDKKKTGFMLGTVALSIAGVIALSATGLGIVATMGLGAGANVLSSRFFKGKLEEQRKELKDIIAKEVPNVLNNSIAESEIKIKVIYDNIAKECIEKQRSWYSAQLVAVEQSEPEVNKEDIEATNNKIKELSNIIEKINNFNN